MGNQVSVKKYHDGSIYKGEVRVVQGQAIEHGNGTVQYANGDLFQGIFENGMRKKGKFIYKNKTIYQGQLKDNQFNGQGKLFLPDHTFHSGYFEAGVLINGSIINQEKNTKYSGQLKNGKFHGHGHRIFSNGDVYIGQFRQGKLHGKGTITYKNGQSYEGQFVQNLFEGKGVLKTRQSQYEGSFMKGVREGEGILKFKNGDQFVGSFRNNVREGTGRYISANQIYEGNYQKDQKHGYGKLQNKNNQLIYEGYWKNDQFGGEGTLHMDKVTIKGNFQRGKCKDPKGTIRTAECLYEGEVSDNVPNGFGKLTFSNGDIYSGNYLKGKKHGKGKYSYKANNQMFQGQFVNDLKEGRGEYRYADGSTEEGEYKRGEREGAFVYRHRTGLREERVYERGRLTKRSKVQ